MEYDAFISHAYEDMAGVARPLAAHLTALGYRVWFDEFSLSLGDSLRRSIDRGLASCRFGVVILSRHFFAKNWPAYELDGLTSREQATTQKIILPIWHGVTREEVAAYSPTLADRVAAVTTLPLDDIAGRIAAVLGPPPSSVKALTAPTKRGHFESEEICPRCGQRGDIFGFEGSDGDEFGWFECSHCGFFEELRN